MSFQQGLSGLNATSKNLQVIGNNIANANTYGTKVSRAEFSDVYANALNGAGANSVGIGTTNHYGTYANMGAYGMAQEAFKNALDDCGLTQDDIDGLIVGSGTGEPTAYDDMARYLRVVLRTVDAIDL